MPFIKYDIASHVVSYIYGKNNNASTFRECRSEMSVETLPHAMYIVVDLVPWHTNRSISQRSFRLLEDKMSLKLTAGIPQMEMLSTSRQRHVETNETLNLFWKLYPKS